MCGYGCKSQLVVIPKYNFRRAYERRGCVAMQIGCDSRANSPSFLEVRKEPRWEKATDFFYSAVEVSSIVE